MEIESRFTLKMPSPKGSAQKDVSIATNGPVVVIGANGSGKSRFGDWLDREEGPKAHRVAAQRALEFPVLVTPPARDRAESSLWFGHVNVSAKDGSKINRWHDKPVTALLNDYSKLVDVLFAEEAERNAEYKQRAKASSVKIEPPATKLDIVKLTWEQALPGRELIVAWGKIEARSKSGTGAIFKAADLSDGERVVFYLAGQAICAPKGAILIIDEPELHLHRSIQTKLWDDIEAARPDCLFVYLTHDLEFAASRRGGTKIWLRDFDGKHWDWEQIPTFDDVPESLTFRILGSRKPVLFVEGESGSIDEDIYTQIYPDWSITPCGSCEHVVHATAVFSAKKAFHHLECRGLIDDDERDASEKDALAKRGIYLLGFTELENALLIPEILRIAADALMPGEKPDTLVSRAQQKILGMLQSSRDRVISRRVAYRIEQTARTFSTKSEGEASITRDWDTLHASVDPQQIYAQEAARLDEIISLADYNAVIRIYPNKGLSQQITGIFGSTNLQSYLRSLLSSQRGVQLRLALAKHLPKVV